MKFTQSLLLCGVATVSVVSAPSLQGGYNGHIEPSMGKVTAVSLLRTVLPNANLPHANPINANPPNAKELHVRVDIGNGWGLKLEDYTVLTKEIRYMCPFYPDKRLLLNDVRELIKTVPCNHFEMSEEDIVDRFTRGVCVDKYRQANAFFGTYAGEEFDRCRRAPQGSDDPLRKKVSEILDHIWRIPVFSYEGERRSQLRKIISQGCEDVRKLISKFSFTTAPSLADHVCHVLENYESHLLKSEEFFFDEFKHDIVSYDELFKKFSDLSSDAGVSDRDVLLAERESKDNKPTDSAQSNDHSDAVFAEIDAPFFEEDHKDVPTWQKIGAGCYMKFAAFKHLIEVIDISHDGGSTIQETWAIIRKRIVDDVPCDAISDDMRNLHADYETVRKLCGITDPMYIPYDEINGKRQKQTPQRTFKGLALRFFREYLVKVYGGGRACRRTDEHFRPKQEIATDRQGNIRAQLFMRTCIWWLTTHGGLRASGGIPGSDPGSLNDRD